MAEKNDQKVKESVESKMEQFYKKLPELLAIAKRKRICWSIRKSAITSKSLI